MEVPLNCHQASLPEFLSFFLGFEILKSLSLKRVIIIAKGGCWGNEGEELGSHASWTDVVDIFQSIVLGTTPLSTACIYVINSDKRLSPTELLTDS